MAKKQDHMWIFLVIALIVGFVIGYAIAGGFKSSGQAISKTTSTAISSGGCYCTGPPAGCNGLGQDECGAASCTWKCDSGSAY